MKRIILATTALTLLTGAPAIAQSFTDRVVETLSQQGFQTTEVKNGPTETKVEAVRGNQKIEVVYDRSTGQIVEQEVEVFRGTLSTELEIEIEYEDEDFSDRARGRDDDDRDDDDDDRDDDDDDRDDVDDRDDHDDDRDDDSDRDDDDGDRDDDHGGGDSDSDSDDD